MRGAGRILKSFTISGSELLVIFCCRVKTAIKHSRYHIKMSSLAGKILGNSSGSIAPGAETAGDNQPGGAPAPAPAPGSHHITAPARLRLCGCVAGFTWHLMPPRPVPRPNSPLVTAASLTQLGPGRAGRTGRAGPGPMPVLLTVPCRAPPGELHSSLRNTTLPPPPRGLLEAPQTDRKRISNRVTL